ncbi:hypothetical protein FQZ97_973040 [compost metagenome]
MTDGTQDQQFEIVVVTGAARTLQAIQLFQVQLAVGAGRCAGDDTAAHIGKQLALVIGQTGGLLQHAGTTAVIDDVAALFLARLEHQLAIGRRELALHARLAGVGGTLTRGVEQLAAAEERQEGDKQQGAGGTHHWVSRQVPPRYSD